ncbi:hypothetical protein N0V90_007793 [Kalmusia sp. IMI 367209]|nr:hypothetical protein N0V90_007793 [Kalmusia sp. IMI 367209]
MKQSTRIALGVGLGVTLSVMLLVWLVALLWRARRRDIRACELSGGEPDYRLSSSGAAGEGKHGVSELFNESLGSPRHEMVYEWDGERGRKGLGPFPPISEMDSPPAELYAPSIREAILHGEDHGPDYFKDASRRRMATRKTRHALSKRPIEDGLYEDLDMRGELAFQEQGTDENEIPEVRSKWSISGKEPQSGPKTIRTTFPEEHLGGMIGSLMNSQDTHPRRLTARPSSLTTNSAHPPEIQDDHPRLPLREGNTDGDTQQDESSQHTRETLQAVGASKELQREKPPSNKVYPVRVVELNSLSIGSNHELQDARAESDSPPGFDGLGTQMGIDYMMADGGFRASSDVQSEDEWSVVVHDDNDDEDVESLGIADRAALRDRIFQESSSAEWDIPDSWGVVSDDKSDFDEDRNRVMKLEEEEIERARTQSTTPPLPSINDGFRSTFDPSRFVASDFGEASSMENASARNELRYSECIVQQQR